MSIVEVRSIGARLVQELRLKQWGRQWLSRISLCRWVSRRLFDFDINDNMLAIGSLCVPYR